MRDVNWDEVEVVEALHDLDWRHMADVLHELSKEERNPDVRKACARIKTYCFHSRNKAL